MHKALLCTILAGLALGFYWPNGGGAGQASSPKAAGARSDEGPRETVLERSAGGHFYANVEVNGEVVRFMVDTGATGIALTEETAERIGIRLNPNAYEVVAMGAGGPVRGQFAKLDKVSLDGKDVRGLTGSVLEGGDTNLLGQEFLGQFTVEMRGDTMRIY